MEYSICRAIQIKRRRCYLVLIGCRLSRKFSPGFFGKYISASYSFRQCHSRSECAMLQIWCLYMCACVWHEFSRCVCACVRDF